MVPGKAEFTLMLNLLAEFEPVEPHALMNETRLALLAAFISVSLRTRQPPTPVLLQTSWYPASEVLRTSVAKLLALLTIRPMLTAPESGSELIASTSAHCSTPNALLPREGAVVVPE